MSPTCKTALRNLLLACADTKLLLGFHYGEWTFGPPQLEAAIACCSLCQTELGHVRLLHSILNKHCGDDPDALVENRAPEDFANISYLDNEINDWSELVAVNYIVDLAVTTLLHSMRNSTFQPLHMSLEKMIDEEKYHIHHGQGWFRTLTQKSSDTKDTVQKSAQKALQSVVEWFGPADEEEDLALIEAGIKSETNSQVLQKLLDNLPKLNEQVDTNSFQWNGWKPSNRRVGNTKPNEQILYHLRGSKNKVFKLN